MENDNSRIKPGTFHDFYLNRLNSDSITVMNAASPAA